jgi:hypothetical protein
VTRVVVPSAAVPRVASAMTTLVVPGMITDGQERRSACRRGRRVAVAVAGVLMFHRSTSS